MKTIGNAFENLTTDHVLDSVEKALDRTKTGRRATGSILALNSLENRVFQMSFEDGLRVVTKFYRPQRWSLEQIFEEHDFLFDCEDSEIPVVSPLDLPGAEGDSLMVSDKGFPFAVFPSVGGRLLDEPSHEQLQVLGRYVARIHQVGSQYNETSRVSLNAKTFGQEPLEFLLSTDLFETESIRAQYETIASRVVDHARLILSDAKTLLVHGDCHLGNTLWQNDQPFFLDFDDMCRAPAVQDIWMIIRGRDDEAIRDREVLLEAYQQLRDFDLKELQYIEALRALRIIHYSAWIAKRREDSSFARVFRDFGSVRYWQDEISELQKVLDYYEGF